MHLADVSSGRVTLLGTGLFTGKACKMHLTRHAPGTPVFLTRNGEGATPIAYLRVTRTVLSTGVSLLDGQTILTVEHLFAALGGLRITTGVSVDVEGDEVPLMDGRARMFVEAVQRLLGAEVPPPAAPRYRVAKLASFEVGESLYRFAPSNSILVSVDFEHENPILVKHARWEGSAHHFATRIAGARTFASEEDAQKYAERGIQATFDRTQVVIVGKDRLFAAGEPTTPDEPARHKLLDLIGDLYVHEGPFEGSLHAIRPGHAKTHEAVRRAKEAGVLLPR